MSPATCNPEEKMAIKTPQAIEAEKLLEKLPDEVKEALEAMQRTTRVRRVFTSEESDALYRRIF